MMTLIYVQHRIFGFSIKEIVLNMDTVDCEQMMKELSLAILRR